MYSKRCVLSILFLFLLSCEIQSDKSFLIFHDFFEQKSEVNTFLLIPIDLGCESCILKAIDFVKNNPSNAYKVVLAGANKKQNSLFLKRHHLKQSDFLKIDDAQFFFKNELIFANPIIYQFEDKVMVSKVELVPLNIDKELLNLKLNLP
jgi:hypothetical protein